MSALKAFKLRDYQDQAVANVINDLKDVERVGLIMPTGSGKTEIFIRVSEEYLAANPDKSVLILSHLSLLTKQTADRFAQRAPKLKVGIFQAGETPKYNTKVIIGTMQTSKTDTKTSFLNAQAMYPVGLIIIDEAHYLSCDSYDNAIKAFPKAKQVGCTATPFRAGALMTNYFDRISFSISIKELIDQGYLVPPKLIEVTHDDPEIASTMALVASLYQTQERGKSALVFMKTIEDAKQMRNVLDDHNIKARAITSELVGDERDKILQDFKDGKIQVLTTVNVLTAGFDSPNVEAIFMPYATKSPTTYLQRIGRGLRICPAIQKTECRIYVVGDTPSIKRELYKKLQNNVLEICSKDRKNSTFEEDLEYGENNGTEVYRWTMDVVRTVKIMRSMKLHHLAKLLNTKQFPKRFMNDIAKFAEGLQKHQPFQNCALPSDAQVKMLLNLGFTVECLNGTDKAQASAMIAAALNVKDQWKTQSHTFTSGKFAGTHVRDTPAFYRMIVKRDHPYSPAAKLIHEYEKSGGTYPVKIKKIK